MARKRKQQAELTREQRLTIKVDEILKSAHMTPAQAYDMIVLGYQVYQQGAGLPHDVVWAAILQGFENNGMTYLNPYKSARLAGRRYPEHDDFQDVQQQLA